jgi:hypothetical protein
MALAWLGEERKERRNGGHCTRLAQNFKELIG